ncbi:hypothetical protein C8J57DRAFT_1476752 [Mycena rebaudengoi]|nr:hypothetical protein C8J57DRAFT_1476752 [Mycena rebaudengoi]
MPWIKVLRKMGDVARWNIETRAITLAWAVISFTLQSLLPEGKRTEGLSMADGDEHGALVRRRAGAGARASGRGASVRTVSYDVRVLVAAANVDVDTETFTCSGRGRNHVQVLLRCSSFWGAAASSRSGVEELGGGAGGGKPLRRVGMWVDQRHQNNAPLFVIERTPPKCRNVPGGWPTQVRREVEVEEEASGWDEESEDAGILDRATLPADVPLNCRETCVCGRSESALRGRGKPVA